jgi:hypothetical protein
MNVFIMIIQSYNVNAVALACTIPLLAMWYLTDGEDQTLTQRRLHNGLKPFIIPIFFLFIYILVIKVFIVLLS